MITSNDCSIIGRTHGDNSKDYFQEGLFTIDKMRKRTELTPTEKERYRRQLLIPQIGEEGQLKLASTTVGILGQGGLGSPCTFYLAAAGVGKLILIDSQTPELSNLNRQILHTEKDVEEGISKALSGEQKVRKLNSDIEVISYDQRITEENIDSLVGEADILVDCLDNFQTRYILNDYCVREHKPFVHAGVEGFIGQITTIVPGETPCLRCIFPSAPSPKGELPIIGATPGVFGALEAVEVIKLITGAGVPLKSRLLFGDLLLQSWDIIEIGKIKDCTTCGHLSLE